MRNLFKARRVPQEPKPLASPAERASPQRQSTYLEDGPLGLYLKEMGKYNLLKPEQEITLGKRMKRGNKHARELMITSNLRLVISIARDYVGFGLPLPDLISEGNIGLIKGIERFDYTRGCKISTYIGWWIRQAITRALANQGKTIRLPVHLVGKIADIRKTTVRLEQELGREPDDEEIADELGNTVEQIKRWKKAAMNTVSLDAPLPGIYNDSATFEDITADEKAEIPSEIAEENSTAAKLRTMIATLNPRESAIILARYGFIDDDPETLEKVGKQFGVTRERIRQVQNMALGKLRKMMKREEAGMSFPPETPKSAATTESYFPLSLEFLQWRPRNGELSNRLVATMSFVSTAYKIPYAKLRLSDEGKAAWARAVAIYLMSKNGISDTAIRTFFEYTVDDFVIKSCTRVELAREKNESVRRDLRAIERYFRLVMGL